MGKEAGNNKRLTWEELELLLSITNTAMAQEVLPMVEW
jgi:hypothetical protein